MKGLYRCGTASDRSDSQDRWMPPASWLPAVTKNLLDLLQRTKEAALSSHPNQTDGTFQDQNSWAFAGTWNPDQKCANVRSRDAAGKHQLISKPQKHQTTWFSFPPRLMLTCWEKWLHSLSAALRAGWPAWLRTRLQSSQVTLNSNMLSWSHSSN